MKIRKFVKKLGSIALAASLTLSAMTGIGQNPGSIYAEAAETEWEEIGGAETDCPLDRTSQYSMKEENSEVTFEVEMVYGSDIWIELNEGEDFITLAASPTEGPSGDGIWTWPPETRNNPTKLSVERSSENISDFDENKHTADYTGVRDGKKYTITVKRTDSADGKVGYSVVVKETGASQNYVTYTVEDSVLKDNPVLYLVAPWGRFKVRSETTPSKRNLSHGTDRTKLYSKADVNNTPPEDYTIPAGLVRDAKDKAYEKYFPKNSIQTVSVEMDDANLNYMLQHALDKPSVMTNKVTIGDTTLGYAGIKTKGNYTMSSTNATTSDRFSFTLNFGKYIKKKQYGAKQNFYGCQKISFNNCFFDKTILKEYNAMRLMDEMGLPTPQYSLAKLYINGKYYGVYFMVEAMDGAIIERYQNVTSDSVSDYLVKPSYTTMSYYFEDELEKCLSANGEFTMAALKQEGLLTRDENGDYHAGGVLQEVYDGIWEEDDDTLQDVATEIPNVLTWNRKIQLLSEGKDFNGNSIDVNSTRYMELLESLMDTDEAVRYFATHSFLTQMDNMFTYGQNYGLYVDKQGKSLFVPWDYDLAWGTANWATYNTAESSANWDMDKMYPDKFVDVENSPWDKNLSVTKNNVYGRTPLFLVIWQNRKLMEKYHTYLSDCSKLVSLGGTTSAGKKFEPARYAKTIEEYYPQVKEAAKTNNLRENVYYVGGIEQPKGAEQGIPELKKLVARRAVSVWLQTQGKDADVTGYDCDILKIGTNFGDLYNKNDLATVSGTLTVVDETTGIFATVTYPGSNTEAWIRAEKLASGQDVYKKISQQMTSPEVYKISLANEKSLTSDYKLYIPVSPNKPNAKIYGYSTATGKLQELKTEKIDNVRCVTGKGLSYIAIGTAVSSGSSGTQKPSGTVTNSDKDTVKKGQTAVVGKLKYKITKVAAKGKGEVSLNGTSRKKSDKKFKTLKIGNEVKIKGKSYKITAIGSKAFSGYKYLKSVTIGKNVSKIQAKAFNKCSKLQKITVKTSKLTKKNVGKQAFKGIHKKAVIKVPAKKLKSYKKIFRARGVGAKAKIKK